MIKVKEGFEEIHEKLVEKRDSVRAKYDALYEEEAKHINNMIGECEEEIPDPVEEEPIEEEPIVEENIVNEQGGGLWKVQKVKKTGNLYYKQTN